MKKNLILILMFFVVIGCAKKFVKAPEEPAGTEGAVIEETLMPETEKEVVEDDIYMGEEAILAAEFDPEAAAAAVKAVFKDVLFEFNKYDIRHDARPILDSVASMLNDNSDIDVIIEGHCDERGTNEYNLALGEKRAKAVRDYLVSLGISSTRVSVITYGEEKPLCTDWTEECWQKNRRAHFVIAE